MRLTMTTALFVAVMLGFSSSSVAQPAVDPYTTNLGLRYDFLSQVEGENSFFGFNADITRMLGGFATGGGWGAGGSIEFEKFESSTLKEFEAYVHAQGKATGERQMSPFGRFGIGLNSVEGFSDLILDFRGGVDFLWKPDAPYLISVMVSLKRVLADGEGFNVLRLSAGIVIPLDK
jgi:hypothetical protein